MNMKDLERHGGTAFPTSVSAGPDGGLDSGTSGMSLRDFFATHAPPMPDDWASFRRLEVESQDDAEQELKLMAQWAYAYADSMLKARQ